MIINVSAVANLIGDHMVGAVDANLRSFINEDDFEYLYEEGFDKYVRPVIPEEKYNEVYDMIYNSDEIQLSLKVIKEMIEEDRQDYLYAQVMEEDRRKSLLYGYEY